MIVNVDWGTRNVNVPRNEMLLVQSSPIEVRQLDLTDFRYALHDAQDSEAGMAYPHIHGHNFAVTVAGVSLAQVVEIVNDYTITFEDGPYNVNVVGGNSNVADRVIKNQVGVNTANSAGLQDSSSLQAASFGEVVALDQANGTPGTTFPIGTKGTPVKTVADARKIMAKNNINRLLIIGSALLDDGDDISGLTIVGHNPTTTQIVINALAITNGAEIQEAYVTGVLDGGTVLRNCLVDNINYFNGFMVDCVLAEGTITLGGGASALLLRCVSGVIGSGTPTIDMGGTGQSFGCRSYSGGLKLVNKNGADAVSIDIVSGQIKFDPTVTNTENIYVRGVARITDESTGLAKIDSVGLLSGERTVRGSGYVVVSADGYSGVTSRNGTQSFPINNITEAIAIAELNDVKQIKILGSVTTDGTEDLSNFIVFSESPTSSSLTVTAGTITTNATFRELNINGVLSSDGAVIERCHIGTISGMQNYIYQCFIYGTVGLSGTTTAAFCAIAPNAVAQRAYFDFMGTALTLVISDWGAGVAVFDNMITGSFAGASGTGGRVELGINNTGGHVVYSGSVLLNPINLETVDSITDSSVAGAVWGVTTIDSTVHTALDSYVNKDDWKADSTQFATTTVDTVVASQL